jgi:hypothetical protein
MLANWTFLTKAFSAISGVVVTLIGRCRKKLPTYSKIP